MSGKPPKADAAASSGGETTASSKRGAPASGRFKEGLRRLSKAGTEAPPIGTPPISEGERAREEEEEEDGDAGGVYARDLAKTLDRYAARVATVLKAHTDAQRSELEKEELALQTYGESTVEEHRQSAVHSWMEYENFKAAAEEQRKLLKFLRQRELDRQLTWHGDLLDAERNYVQDAAVRFNEEMQSYSKQLIERLWADQPKSPGRQEDTLQTDEKKLRAERERIYKKAVQETEEEVTKAFQETISESRREWLVFQQRALLRVEEELRAAHESGAAILERQVKAGEKFGRAAQERWKSRLIRSRAQLQQLAAAYEQVLRKAYEDQLAALKNHIEEQAQFYKHELKEVHAKWEHDRNGLQSQLRKMRIALAKWRFDYAQDAEARANAAIVAAAEREATMEAPKEGRASVIAAMEAKAKTQEPDGATKLANRRDTLQRLWRGLETSEDEIKNFYRRLERYVPFTSEALTMYDAHIAKYGRSLMQEMQGSNAPIGPCQKMAALQQAQGQGRAP